MGVEWVDMVQNMIFSRIKSEFSDALKKKYDMTDEDNFSAGGRNVTPSVFPFIHIQCLPSTECGMDTERADINAGMFTFQVDVTDNMTSYERAKKCSLEVLRTMKSMGFETQEFPNLDMESDLKRYTLRFRRILCEGETI